MGLPLSEVLNSLQLSDDLREALLNHVGPVGQALRSAVAHERGCWPEMGFADLPACEVRGAYLSAIREAHSIWSGMAG
jgi:hypothetical protein